MKTRLATLLSLAAALTMTVGAQQIPNSSFENWKTACGSSEAVSKDKESSCNFVQRPGIEPTDWNGSNVNQTVMGVTATESGLVTKNDTEKHSGSASVQLKNIKVGLKILGRTYGSVAPGYLTFGTPWVYATTTVSKCNGGTYGGVQFNSRPDAISGWYKRTDSNAEDSNILAYLWKGTFKSKVGEMGNTLLTREDCDRAIIGLETPDQSGTLVAKAQHSFRSTGGEWQNIVVPFEYSSTEAPEKMNVVICGGSYWNRTDLVEGTTLLVDDVKFVYHSRLSAIKVNGIAVPDYYADTYSYTLDTTYSPDHEITVTHMGKSATHSVTFDDAAHTATITVKNDDADIDGQTSHTYTLQFAAPAPEPRTYEGVIKIFLGDDPMEVTDQVVKITMTGDDTCTFSLDNFSLSGDPSESIGNIVVTDVKLAPTTINGKPWTKYTGSAPDMQLAEGEIVADVELEAYENANHDFIAYIHVLWAMDPDDKENTTVPIHVEFRTNNFDTVTGIDGVTTDATDAEPRYFTVGGVEVKAPLQPGLYIVRRGNETQKLLVK